MEGLKMKKLPVWVIVCLVVVYPVGILFLIYWLLVKYKVIEQFDFLKIVDDKRVPIHQLFGNVVGCSYENGDGSSRQEALKNCKIGDVVTVRPAPTNEYPDSVGVFTAHGNKQIGVLSYNLVNELMPYCNEPKEIVINNIMANDRGIVCSLVVNIYAH